MNPSTPTRSRGTTAALSRGMGMLSLDSPLADVPRNMLGSPRHTAKGKVTRMVVPPSSHAPRLDKEDKIPGTSNDVDRRGVVSKDWEGPEVSLAPRRRNSAMVSRGDRYIPNRELLRSGHSAPFLEDGAGEALSRPSSRASSPSEAGDLDTAPTASALEGACHVELGQRILSFSAAPPTASHAKDVRARYAPKSKSTLPSSLLAAGRRRIPTAPERVLDAPAIVPDFYVNLLHWSSQNVIAIALQSAVHTWNSETGEANFLLDLEEEGERVGGGPGSLITSLRWDAHGTILAVSTDRGYTQIWDAERGVRLRTLRPSVEGGADAAALNAAAWAVDGTLSVGYASGLLREHDVRQRASETRSIEHAHAAQVCGLAWREDSALLASGGNDNVVKVWDRRTNVAKMRKENHRAAVKALAWSPHNSSLLATGGGSADRCIHFWNTTQNTRVQTIQTAAQVTSLQWAPHYREIVSAHGVGTTEGQSGALCVWAHPSGQKVAEVSSAHDGRILHTTLSPDGQTLATVGSDESLKFWRLFEQAPDAGKAQQRGVLPGTYKGLARAAPARSLR
ncbi:WD repeat-containing protein Slp1 [Malassezia pachydermatis]|uniref:Cdc20-cell division control protein n=1 Tax=Malassezia pachydermatis TaxID=77020 RepID=A0A0M8MJM8_9BASI|nr:cdc20-cell division control protein [Malassezia pachydermatis]KOS13816.1 cdc20-cell division control protein [Malassezia pachydermatis]